RNDRDTRAAVSQFDGLLDLAAKGTVNPVTAGDLTDHQKGRFLAGCRLTPTATHSNSILQFTPGTTNELTGEAENLTMERYTRSMIIERQGNTGIHPLRTEARRTDSAHQHIQQLLFLFVIQHTIGKHFVEAWKNPIAR